ncbi:peptidyl-prolyl cis-trans isomerase 1 [Phtheirospermum japonicum]|uniref:Peptidyl-prolyl cis-trans isomerase 1 n=1 Tax=Phtheirospermum japonicum TaxID=374723 RepID=A0A830DIQ9_9LAMI|nr:peptidyl-prolyl cis-trans isomerase 1 [Phtheirospermum japonicum]
MEAISPPEMAPEASRSTNPSSPTRTLSRSTPALAFCPWRKPDLGPMDPTHPPLPLPPPFGQVATKHQVAAKETRLTPHPPKMAQPHHPHQKQVGSTFQVSLETPKVTPPKFPLQPLQQAREGQHQPPNLSPHLLTPPPCTPLSRDRQNSNCRQRPWEPPHQR